MACNYQKGGKNYASHAPRARSTLASFNTFRFNCYALETIFHQKFEGIRQIFSNPKCSNGWGQYLNMVEFEGKSNCGLRVGDCTRRMICRGWKGF